MSATSFVPVPATTTPFLSAVPSSPFAVTVAVPDAATVAPPSILTSLPAVSERPAFDPAPMLPSVLTTPAITVASFTLACPETLMSTPSRAVTVAPPFVVNEPDGVVASPTRTLPFAATVAPSTVTAPVASMPMSFAESALAPPWTMTEVPSPVAFSESAPSAPTFAASTVTPFAPVIVKSLPASTAVSAPETSTEPFAEETIVSLPSALFRAATYAPSLMTTLPSPVVA